MDTTATLPTTKLAKGGNAPLTTTKDGAPSGMTTMHAGLSWDEGTDCDAIVLGLDANGKLVSIDKHVLYWGVAQKAGIPQGKPFDILGGALRHSGDERTGATAGDDEVVEFHFDIMKNACPEVKEWAIIAHCYNEPGKPKVTFGNVKEAKIRTWNPADPNKAETNLEFDLTEDYGTAEAVEFARIYMKDGEWKLRAKGEEIPNATDINAIVAHYSVV